MLQATLTVSALPSRPYKCDKTTTASDVVVGHDMTNKRVLITGGDSGLGLATALALAEAASYDIVQS